MKAIKELPVLSIIENSLRNAVQKHVSVGEQKYSGLKIPLNAHYAICHVGVFGATGMGKSRLVKALIDELIKHYAIIAFDHTGVDYAPFYKDEGCVVSSKSIEISADAFSSVVIDMARLDRSTYLTYFDIASLVSMGEDTEITVKRGTISDIMLAAWKNG